MATMRITRITAWRVDLPLTEGAFRFSGGTLDAFDSTVVRIDTDDGVTGWGEVCPLGPVYLPAYAEGARTGIAHLAPHLLGIDPIGVAGVNRVMDGALTGHPYAKSAIDMACWDLLGKHAGLPVSTLMGGDAGGTIPLYRAISQGSAEEMAEAVGGYRAEGYRHFQLKVGGDPDTDIVRIRTVASLMDVGDRLIADANSGWRVFDAARVVEAIRDLDVAVEQPCASYDHCRSIRRRTSLPFVLDESIDGLSALLRAHADGAMDMINLKVSKVGGLTRAMQIRDVCVGIGTPMILEDSCGGDLATAAVTHLAQSTPEPYRFASTDLNGYVTRRYDERAPRRRGGSITAPTQPGLGVEPDPLDLGVPVIDVGR
jgi:L-alanine-DL-glutamate epimerase-like enolase superfamily enzyme